MWQAAIQRIQGISGNALPLAADWVLSVGILVGVALLAWLSYAVILAVARRVLGERHPLLRSTLNATEGPARLALILLALAIALPSAPLDPNSEGILARVIGLATICLLGWAAAAALHIAADLYLLRFRIDVADNLFARKHVRVLVRILDVVIALVTIGFAL